MQQIHGQDVDQPFLPSNITQEVENDIARIMRFEGSEENKQLILDFDRQCCANGNKLATRNSYLLALRHFQQFARNHADDKSFKVFDKEDIVRFLELEKHRTFEGTHYIRSHKKPSGSVVTESTMNMRRHVIRKFFAYLHNYKKGFPPMVDWMKVSRIGRNKENRIDPSDLVTPEEIYAIISCAECPRDRALLSLLAESGMRVGEASVLRIKDLKHTDKGLEVSVNGKTGPRTIPLVICKPDLDNWLNDFHMFRSDPKAPLFPRFSRKQLAANLRIYGIANVVDKAVIRARKVKPSLETKNVTPHSFRHARATELAALGWTEAMLRIFFGWTSDSTMPSVYIHLSQADIGQKYYQMYGRTGDINKKSRKLEENKPCPSCGVRNPTGYVTCFSCDKPVNSEAVGIIEDKKTVANTLNFIATDAILSKKFSLLLEEALVKQKN
jgi:integrase